MKRGLAIVALAATALSGSADPGSAPAFSNGPAGITRVDVMVEDRNGKSVSGLTQADFEIWSNDRQLPVDAFTAATATTPLTLVVLVDISASLYKCPCCKVLVEPQVKTVGRGLSAASSDPVGVVVEEFALRGLQPQDRVRVGSIGRRVTMSERFPSGSSEHRQAWKSLFDVPPVEWLGPSPIWDGVAEAASVLVDEPGHRAIVLITDGQASGNRYGHKEVAARVALAGISVNVVAQESMLPQVPLAPMASRGVDPTQALRTMAGLTGGSFELARAEFGHSDNCYSSYPAPLVTRLLDRLHQAYTLSFVTPAADGNFHALDVRVKKPGMVVRARKIFPAG